MGYNYEEQKPRVFEEGNQRMFLEIRDKTKHLLSVAGAFRLDSLTRICAGDSWVMLACVDRLLELGELREVPTDGPAQHRLFLKGL